MWPLLGADLTQERAAHGGDTGNHRLLPGAALFALYFAVLATRRMDVFTDPKLFAEDGQIWYAAAHNLNPWQALVSPYAGYYQFFPRLMAFALTPLGLSATAVVFGTVSIAMAIMPPLLFASRRFRFLVRDDLARAAAGIVYLILIPADFQGNVTFAQWHLAVAAFLVLVAAAPRSKVGLVFDVLVLVVAGLTGPFAILLLPISLWIHRGARDRRHALHITVLACTAALQACVLLLNLPSAHRSQSLGVSGANFVLIIANQMLSRVGHHLGGRSALILAAALTSVVIVVLAAAAAKGPRALLQFTIFATLVVCAGLLAPPGQPAAGQSAWSAMADGTAGDRYFFILAVALAASVLVLGSRLAAPHLRLASGATLAVALLVLISAPHWRLAPPPSEHLDAYQAAIDHAKAGTVITIPIDPPGWQVQLTAH